MPEVGNLTATLSLDSSEFTQGVNSATEQTNVFADILSANLATKAIGLAVDGLKKLGEVATNTFKDAIKGFADYEQLVGGVETLFKDSSDTILAYADEAYKTAGISANEYMETVTSFSASLIQSTGRQTQQDLDALEKTLDEEYKAAKRHLDDQYDIEKDFWDKKIKATKDSGYKQVLQDQRDEALKLLKRSNEDELAELKQHTKDVLAEAEKLNSASVTTEASLQRAAELANQAIIDMSDNANKMGSDMSSIQTAYQGFAKQNYTMLDNLKLGYGGTKSEMERLLSDAEDLLKKQGELRDFSVDSYADIVEAIHVVQTEMGITGTTAKEASSTISGSINAMKAAWHNLIAGLGNDNANIKQLVDDLFEKINTVWENLKPVAERVLNNMFETIKNAMPKIIDLGIEIGKWILKGIAEALATIVLTPVAWIAKATGLADLFLDGRASGGPVTAGVPYMTGELGPELFIPATDGYVLNHEDTQDFLEGSNGITININGDVYDDARSMKQKVRTAVLGVLQEQVAYG